MESSNESIPDNWEEEAEEATKEEVETWKKETVYVFKTDRDEGYTLNNYTSLVDHDDQISEHYTNKKDQIPKDPLIKKEIIPKIKQEEIIERIDKQKLIQELTGQAYTKASLKETINIVFIGHVDAGKSTVCGGLILGCKKIEQRVVEQYELEAIENNRQSWWLAYIMDVNEDEREKGITIEVGRAFLETDNRLICILDAPGHKSFVPNMITAAAQADVAAVVISARPGEFEAGFQKGGQTMEHILLCKSMGVENFIMIITKMDTVDWDESRFVYIKNNLLPFLRENCRLVETNLVWIPISGIEGKNLIVPGACSWYNGKGFLSLLDTIEIQPRLTDYPLRIPIFDKVKDQGTVILGKIEAGLLVKGMKAVIMPDNIETEVVEIMGVEDIKMLYAEPGMNVRIRIKGSDEFKAGAVLCDPYDFPLISEEFTAEILFLDLLPHKPLILPGYTCVIHIGVAVTDCTFQEITAKYDPVTKKKVKIGYCKGNTRIIAKIKLKEIMCIEKYSAFKALGRFTLRDEDITIALGKIIDVLL